MDNSTTPELSVEIQQLIHELNEAYVLLYSEFACLAVAVYHIIISFDEEVQLIWRRPINFPVILYVFARYIQPIFYMLEIVSSLWPKAGEDKSVCDAIANTANILQIFFTTGVRGLLCLRAYALSGKKWLAIVLLGGTFLADITCYIVAISMFPGCLELDAIGQNSLVTAELACGLANDTVVLVITMYELWGRLRSKPSVKNDFGSVLIKQGLLRYLFVIAIATQEMASLFTSSINSSISGTYVTLFSSIIVSDFLLALRRHNTRSSDHSETISAGLIWSVRPVTVPPRDVNDKDFSISSLFHSANAQIMADFTIHEDEIGPPETEPLNSDPNESNNTLNYNWNSRNSRSFPSYIGDLADTYQLEEWTYEMPRNETFDGL